MQMKVKSNIMLQIEGVVHCATHNPNSIQIGHVSNLGYLQTASTEEEQFQTNCSCIFSWLNFFFEPPWIIMTTGLFSIHSIVELIGSECQNSLLAIAHLLGLIYPPLLGESDIHSLILGGRTG